MSSDSSDPSVEHVPSSLVFIPTPEDPCLTDPSMYRQCEVYFKVKDADGRPKKVATTWYVHKRYTLLETLGSGGYGVVCSATDNEFNLNVAMKRVPKPFEKPIEGLRLLRELKLLSFFRSHENIISLRDIMRPVSYAQFTDVYFVTELMQTDLHWLIRSPQDLSPAHVQYFAYQMLRALKYMHSAQVLHRDLKPGNVLVNKDCSLKICDLGLARGVDIASDADLTEYVVTRWYRAPELLLQSRHYNSTIDIWSCGCIIAELFNRKPLFPGRDYLDQLNKILAVCGTPSEDVLRRMGASEQAKRWLKMQPRKMKVPIASLLPPSTPQLAIDLLEKMLEFDPHQRITAAACLRHPYFAGLANEANEQDCDRTFDWSFEKNGQLSCDQIKHLVWEQVVQFHPDLATQRHL